MIFTAANLVINNQVLTITDLSHIRGGNHHDTTLYTLVRRNSFLIYQAMDWDVRRNLPAHLSSEDIFTYIMAYLRETCKDLKVSV